MAITSREMVDYVYAAVVIPLKGLEVPSFEPRSNPFEGLKRNAYLNVRMKPSSESFSHNYERHAYDRTAKLQVVFEENYSSYPIAEYDRDKRELVIFGDVAREHRVTPFTNILYRLFDKTRPYYKVRVVKEAYEH